MPNKCQRIFSFSKKKKKPHFFPSVKLLRICMNSWNLQLHNNNNAKPRLEIKKFFLPCFTDAVWGGCIISPWGKKKKNKKNNKVWGGPYPLGPQKNWIEKYEMPTDYFFLSLKRLFQAKKKKKIITPNSGYHWFLLPLIRHYHYHQPKEV